MLPGTVFLVNWIIPYNYNKHQEHCGLEACAYCVLLLIEHLLLRGRCEWNKNGGKIKCAAFSHEANSLHRKHLNRQHQWFPSSGGQHCKDIRGPAPSAYTEHRFPDSCNVLLPYFLCSSLSHNIMGKYHFKQHLADFSPSVQKDRQM